mmetsp:Transcript_23780/g.68829  ORF Transcript_23780/g.68829 Transcript_23780/m.68829 type:complete len:234 (-) Transcript_23780:72-773(-)
MRVQHPDKAAALAVYGEDVCEQRPVLFRRNAGLAGYSGVVAGRRLWHRAGVAARAWSGLLQAGRIRPAEGRIARAPRLDENAAGLGEAQAHLQGLPAAPAGDRRGDTAADPGRLLARLSRSLLEAEGVHDQGAFEARLRKAVAPVAAALQDADEGLDLREAAEMQCRQDQAWARAPFERIRRRWHRGEPPRGPRGKCPPTARRHEAASKRERVHQRSRSRIHRQKRCARLGAA